MATRDKTLVSLGDIGALRLKVGGSLVGKPPIKPFTFPARWTIQALLYERCAISSTISDSFWLNDFNLNLRLQVYPRNSRSEFRWLPFVVPNGRLRQLTVGGDGRPATN